MSDLDEECRKADLERAFMKYGPLKEIWLASYAPFYAFIVFRNRLDAQVSETGPSWPDHGCIFYHEILIMPRSLGGESYLGPGPKCPPKGKIFPENPLKYAKYHPKNAIPIMYSKV